MKEEYELFSPENIKEVYILSLGYSMGIDIRVKKNLTHQEQFNCLKNRTYEATKTISNTSS